MASPSQFLTYSSTVTWTYCCTMVFNETTHDAAAVDNVKGDRDGRRSLINRLICHYRI